MRFILLDRIVAVTPGKQIEAIKNLTVAEEYLADHFPLFPVMPGVLMLEAMTQASAWLIRVTENFEHSIVVLKEARNVKYADFVRPGRTLVVSAEVVSQHGPDTTLKAQGTVDGRVNVSARLVLTRYNLADTNPNALGTDNHVRQKMRTLYKILQRDDDTVSPSTVKERTAAPDDVGAPRNGATQGSQHATPAQ